jgi:hypothetical protein
MKREEKRMERIDRKVVGDYSFRPARGIALADGARADAIPNAAGGEGGHGAAKPEGIIHGYRQECTLMLMLAACRGHSGVNWFKGMPECSIVRTSWLPAQLDGSYRRTHCSYAFDSQQRSYFAYADSKAKMGPMYKHYEKGDARGGSQAQK